MNVDAAQVIHQRPLWNVPDGTMVGAPEKQLPADLSNK